MEFFRDSKFDFMKYRRFWVAFSLVVVAGSIVVLFGGLNIGIDFAGGTQLTLRFHDEPDVEVLRGLLTNTEPVIENVRIQRFGEESDNEVILKTPSLEGQDEGSRGVVVDAFDRHFNPDRQGRFDLNQSGTEALTSFLLEKDPENLRADDDEAARVRYEEVSGAIMRLRRQDGLIQSWEQVEGVEEISGQVASTLRSEAHVGAFSILAAENVGPEIGGELRTKGILAVVFSLAGMLIYIWIRFELRFGIGALVALVHDVFIALGLYALLGYEFNLATIAGFLTVVGYSVNDSVVIFDRVRENMRRSRREPLVSVLNTSLNQTLARTVLTSGTTLLVVTTLFVFGGDVIRGFSFVLMVGVVSGTYSSVFIASPFVLLWERLWGRDPMRRRTTEGRPEPQKVAASGRR